MVRCESRPGVGQVDYSHPAGARALRGMSRKLRWRCSRQSPMRCSLLLFTHLYPLRTSPRSWRATSQSYASSRMPQRILRPVRESGVIDRADSAAPSRAGPKSQAPAVATFVITVGLHPPLPLIHRQIPTITSFPAAAMTESGSSRVDSWGKFWKCRLTRPRFGKGSYRSPDLHA